MAAADGWQSSAAPILVDDDRHSCAINCDLPAFTENGMRQKATSSTVTVETRLNVFGVALLRLLLLRLLCCPVLVLSYFFSSASTSSSSSSAIFMAKS